MKDFRKYLHEEPVIILDGGMGTSLYDKGVFINMSFDEMNLNRPDLVKEVHKEFIDAGSNIIETNSFGANSIKLSKYGIEEKVYDINSSAAKIAKELAGDTIYVAGVIGPLGVKVRPFGSLSEKEAFEAFREQAKGLHDGGVDLYMLETFTYLNELEQAVKAVKNVTDKPVFSLVTVNDNGSTLIGVEPSGFVPAMEEWGVDGLGVNCSVGPQTLLNAVELIMEIATLPVVAQPNAGVPRNYEGRNIYLCSPEYISEYAKKYVELGVKIVGGCCGTNGEHIKEIRIATKGIQSSHKSISFSKEIVEKPDVDIVLQVDKSRFAKKLYNKEFVTTVEITPPKGWDYSRIIDKAKLLYENNIDCINIPDGPRASARMSPQVLSILVQKEVGIETILHYCCRDRNLLGMQSDLLGNYSAGLKNILIITGDPPKMGDYPDATAVFDVDAIGLTKIVDNLNQGIDIGYNPIGKPTGYFVGVGANPDAIDMKRELDRFFQKVEAGAEYVITQPVFDINSLLKFLDNVKEANIPIIAGIWPLVSLRNAEFMKYEVPGVHVPDHIIERMKKPKTKEDSVKEGIQICREVLNELKDKIQGAQVSAPFGHVKYSLEVLDGII